MFKQWRYGLLVGVGIAVAIFVAACGGSSSTSSTPTAGAATIGTPGAFTCVSGSLTVNGSTALAPLVQKVATDYQKKCSGANITVQATSSGTGRTQVENGTVGIGMSDVFATAGQADLVDHQVSVVIFSVIVNSKLGVTNLTTAQIQGIYNGSITNWKQVNGPDQAITVVSRPSSSGTRATFQTYVLGGPEKITGPQSLVNDTTSVVISEVGQTPGAIGYAALGSAKGSSAVTEINIDGNAPTASLVESNTYKFWNIEHMYTKGKPTQLAQALIDYMSSQDGQNEANGLSFVPLTSMQQSAIQAHQPSTSTPTPAASTPTPTPTP